MLIPNVPYGNNHTSSITGTSTILNKVNLLGKFILVLQIYPYYCIFFSLLLKVLKKNLTVLIYITKYINKPCFVPF